MTPEQPTIFVMQVWREGGFRVSLRAVDDTGLHWFDAPEPLARWLAEAPPAAPEDHPLTGGSA